MNPSSDNELSECRKIIKELMETMDNLTKELEHERKTRNEFRLGIEIIKKAAKIDELEFLLAAKEFFDYKKTPDYLSRELGPRLLEAKRRVTLREDDPIDLHNFKDFYTQLLNLMASDPKRKPGSEQWSPNSILVPQIFEPQEHFKSFPPIILDFQEFLDVTREENFVLPTHRIAVKMLECFSKYESQKPPKYFVGVILSLVGAEMFIVHSQSVIEKKISGDTVLKVSFKWSVDTLFKIIKKNEEEEREIEDFSRFRLMLKRNKTSETNAECSCYFFALFDFIVYLLQEKKLESHSH